MLDVVQGKRTSQLLATIRVAHHVNCVSITGYSNNIPIPFEQMKMMGYSFCILHKKNGHEYGSNLCS